LSSKIAYSFFTILVTSFFGIHYLVDGSGELLLHGQLQIDFYFSCLVVRFEFKWLIDCDRVALIYQLPLIFNGIHGYFSLSYKQQKAFTSISLLSLMHSPINHAINFILSFLDTGYEINMSNHHNIFDESVLRCFSSFAHACYL
jgi:hypothetical protein